jgi:hypothetical protein
VDDDHRLGIDSVDPEDASAPQVNLPYWTHQRIGRVTYCFDSSKEQGMPHGNCADALPR